jgi:hypothetical protein
MTETTVGGDLVGTVALELEGADVEIGVARLAGSRFAPPRRLMCGAAIGGGQHINRSGSDMIVAGRDPDDRMLRLALPAP